MVSTVDILNDGCFKDWRKVCIYVLNLRKDEGEAGLWKYLYVSILARQQCAPLWCLSIPMAYPLQIRWAFDVSMESSSTAA